MADGPTDILDGPVTPAAAPVVTVAPPRDLIGRTLGKFTVLERLGKGGAGEVFRAEQAQLGRSAVIKVLKEASTGTRVERFLREAKLASQLDHPYAAHIYSFGAEPDGVLWIAMEHVRGGTLDELVQRRGPMPATVFGPLFQRLCEVVHTAHELGIVHRDIKGGNVMVIERAGQLLPKLLDFGIAKNTESAAIYDGEAQLDDELTGQGATLGSPHYMSPEQWESPADVDARADIYALGVLAYRCVSGRLPFHDVPRPGLPDAHSTRPVPPLPERVPARLSEAILHALEKDPDERWPTAIAFGEAVQRAVGGAVVEVVPIFDPATRSTWTRGGPQPIADAVAHLASATTTVEADAALRELVAICCRWLCVIALGRLGNDGDRDVRERARAIVGSDDGLPWLELARAAAAAHPLPGLAAALAGSEPLAALAERLDERERARSLVALASDIAAMADALRALEPLLAYMLVVGRDGAAESWQGPRRRDRERLVVWGDALAEGEVALLDGTGTIVVRLSPYVQVLSPLPSAEPELFLLWRGGRGSARLVAAPWGFERDDDDAGLKLSLLTTEDEATSLDLVEDRSPYAGLAPYGKQDADRFVGREREVEALANRLVRAPLLAVLGPSGAGKSSFIHAGVVPRLAENYEILAMRPGRHPLHVLAASLRLPSVASDVDTEDSDGLVQRLRALGERSPRGLVIVIDQFEELVTLCTDDVERTRFAEVLAACADDPASPVRVVVTLRDDFATVIEREEALRGKFDVFVLAAPSADSLRRIVVEPARRAGVTVDPKVVDAMVAAVVGRPASLPLLSFTAAQLWATRDRAAKRIQQGAYEAIGGVAGALSTYADEVYESLARRDQEVVRDLFSRLVATDGTRIPVPREELEQLAGAAAVLAHLIDARLLVVREADGIDIVEVVHECLAERWQRLARWRSEDAADRALLGDVRVAARRWDDSKRDPDLLWRGEALAELRRLADHASLTDVERDFARESDRVALRARRIRRGLAIAAFALLGGVAVVMGYLGLVANRSRAAAETSASAARDAAELAEERLTASLVAQGKRELNDDRGIAALAYFGEALSRGADSPGLRFMIGLASRAWPWERQVVRDAKVSTVALVGDALVVADHFGKARWYRDHVLVGEAATELGSIYGVRAHPKTGEVMMIANGGIAVIDGTTHAVIRRVPFDVEPLGGRWGPGADEMTVVFAGVVRVFDRTTGALKRELVLEDDSTDIEPAWNADATAVFVAMGTEIIAIDTVKMTTRSLEAKTYDGPIGTPTGAVIAWLDHVRVVHVMDAAGKTTTFKPTNNPDRITVSSDGERIGAISDNALALFDRRGKELDVVPMMPNQTVIALVDDDVWAGTTSGTLRRYGKDGVVASLPVQVTEIQHMQVLGPFVVAIASDATLVVVDRAAQLVQYDPVTCESGSYVNQGLAMGYRCEKTEEQTVFYARAKLGVLHSTQIANAVRDPLTGRGAAVGSTIIEVYDAGTKTIGSTTKHLGPVAFASADELFVVDHPIGVAGTGRRVFRWKFATDTWTDLGDLPVKKGVGALFVVPGGLLVGGDDELVLVDPITLAEKHREPMVDPVEYLTASRDRRWVAVTLVTGGTLLVDGATGAIVKQFAPADAVGVAAALDATGELMTRAGRGGVTVWDRTGEELVWGFDLLRPALVTSFHADGRLEFMGRATGILDIRPERRPREAILEDIRCRVPLRVTSGRLEPHPGSCK